MSIPFQINSTYNFNTRAPAILGTDFKNAKVLGVFDYDSASAFINPQTSHVNVYPYLPPGTVDDPKTYTYVLIKTQSGQKTILALPWIDESTIELVTAQKLTVVIQNIASGDAERIRDSLTILGFSTFVLTVENI